MKLKVLVVIDYQNDFVAGSLGFEEAEELDSLICDKIFDYKDHQVFYTLDTHDEEYLESTEGKALPVEHCIKGTKGHEIYGRVKKCLHDVKAKSLEKRSFGIHPQELHEQGFDFYEDEVESIELVGVVTNICVLSNAVVLKTLYPEARIIVDARACASEDQDLHEKALDVLEGLFVEVINR